MIRRLGPDEGDLLKELRLSALRDAPTAFGATWEEAVAYPDSVWRERLHPDANPAFVWEDEHGAHGLVVGVHDPPGQVVHLVAMWVRPTARGTGAADALVAAVLEWARRQAERRVRLRVTAGNERAERLYGRHGFVRTGRVERRARDGRDEIEMEVALAGSR